VHAPLPQFLTSPSDGRLFAVIDKATLFTWRREGEVTVT